MISVNVHYYLIAGNMYTWFEQTISTNKDRSLSVMWLGLFPVIIISDHAAVEVGIRYALNYGPNFLFFSCNQTNRL